MRWLVLLWRRMVPVHHYKTIILFTLALNVVIYLYAKRYLSDSCISTKHTKFTDVKPDLEEKGKDQISDLREEFNWKVEARILIDAVPALALNKSKTVIKEKDGDLELGRSKVLEPISDHVKDKDIISLLLLTYNVPLKNHSIRDAADVYNARQILNCDDMEFLELRSINPQLTFPTKKNNLYRGEMRLHDGFTVNVAKYVHHINDNKNLQFFKNILDHFYKLLKTQHWPGIPRIYGACLLTKKKKDATQIENEKIEIAQLSYVVDRYDDGKKLCNVMLPTDDCVGLNSLTRYVRKQPIPAITSLKIMKGIGETFQTLWLNGVFPFEFELNDLVITKDFELVFTSLDSFIFLDPGIEPFTYRRVLSGTTCKTWNSCPVPSWRDSHFLFRLGQACTEVKGHCDDNNRCWGMDSMTHLCAFSKWIFHQLSLIIPLTWKHIKEVTNLLVCTSHTQPEHRCDWTTFLRGIDIILKLAEESWENKARTKEKKLKT